jgi:hypothetical protein
MKEFRHSGEGRNPAAPVWIPAFAGMTRVVFHISSTAYQSAFLENQVKETRHECKSVGAH